MSIRPSDNSEKDLGKCMVTSLSWISIARCSFARGQNLTSGLKPHSFQALNAEPKP
jgi:hypothetical protein